MIWFLLYLAGIFPSLWFMCKTAYISDSNGEIFLGALLWPIYLSFIGILELKDYFPELNPLNKLINKWRER